MNTEFNVVHGTAKLKEVLGIHRMAGNAVVVDSPPGYGKSECAWAITTDPDYTKHMQGGFDPSKLAPDGPKVCELRVGLYEDYDFPGPLFVDRSDNLRTHLHPTLDALAYGDTLLLEEIKLRGANKVAMMLLEGKRPRVGHWTGPEHVFRLGLANGSEDGGLECVDNAVVGNRHAHIRWTGPTVAERESWGLENGENPIILAALRMEGEELLRDYDPSRMRNCTPRSLHNASSAMNAMEQYNETAGIEITHNTRTRLLAQYLNDSAALKISAVFALRDRLVPFSAILRSPSGAEIPSDPASLMMLCSTIVNNTNPDNFDIVMGYIERLPIETQAAAVDPILKKHPELAATTAAQAYLARSTALRAA